MEYFKDTGNTLKNIVRRLRTKDFSGSSGIAMKNSSYQILTNLTAKIGSLIFTVVLARILMPELFGLYSLALSTIMVFIAFSDFGINQTITRFVSVELGKNNDKKAKAYFLYLGKIKLVLILFSITFLMITARFISENYYQKPLYLALIMGAFYILFSGLFVILKSLFEALNNFKIIFYQEFIFQVIRIILMPGILLLILKFIISDNLVISYIIGGLSLSYLISFVFYFLKIKKSSFLKEKDILLTKKEKKGLKKFIIAISLIILSGVFFNYINTIMLGYFVESEFIGYYTAAFSLISSSSILIIFSSALLPVFSRLKKKELERLYKKTMGIVLAFSTLLFLFFFIFSHLIINILFGESYLASANILRLLSLLLILIPLTSLLTTYFIAVGKPAIISKVLIISTLMNIVLNYLLISKLVVFGQLFGVYGAIIAAIISNIFGVFFLMAYRKK